MGHLITKAYLNCFFPFFPFLVPMNEGEHGYVAEKLVHIDTALPIGSLHIDDWLPCRPAAFHNHPMDEAVERLMVIIVSSVRLQKRSELCSADT